MGTAAPSPSPLDRPTPPSLPKDPENPEAEEAPVSITDIDLDDSAELTAENMRALLARAKIAGKDAARKTRMAFNTTKALADSGLLKLPRTTRHRRNGTVG